MRIKLNPVYRKELKSGSRTLRTFLIIFAYNLVLAFIGLISFYFTFSQRFILRVRYADILQIYLFLTVIEFALLLFVVPAFTSSAISGEREKQTLEILLTSTLTPGNIIRGKLLSSISSTLILIFSSLPILGIVFSVGGVRLTDLIAFMVFCTVTAIYIGSIGIFFSTVFKKTAPSTIITYGTIVFLILGTFLIVYSVFFLRTSNYDSQFQLLEQSTIYEPPDVGNLILILLINPAVSLLSLLNLQMGSSGSIEDYVTRLGSTNPFILQHWYGFSITIQLTISFVLLRVAEMKLNPNKRKKRYS